MCIISFLYYMITCWRVFFFMFLRNWLLKISTTNIILRNSGFLISVYISVHLVYYANSPIITFIIYILLYLYIIDNILFNN